MDTPNEPIVVPTYRRLYARPEQRLQDDPRFRRRLATIVPRHYFATLESNNALGLFMEANFGLEIRHGTSQGRRRFYFELHFLETPIEDVLESVTAIARYLSRKDPELLEHWVKDVRRVLVEEHMAYRVDNEGVLHPFVDEAFELARISVIEALQGNRFNAAREHFEAAIDAMKPTPPDTRAAVRHCFEAAENLFKLLTGTNQDLTKANVGGTLTPIVDSKHAGSDQAMQRHVGRMVSSFGNWADAGHPYRHAQGANEIQAPTPELAVQYLNTGAGYIRWLATMCA